MKQHVVSVSLLVSWLVVGSGGCTKAGRSIVNVDLTAEVGIVGLDSVTVTATTPAGNEVGHLMQPWNSMGLKLGVYIPASVSGLIRVAAIGSSKATVGMAAMEIAHSDPTDPAAQVSVTPGQATATVTLMLKAGPSTTPPDGGTDSGSGSGGVTGTDGGNGTGGNGNGGRGGGTSGTGGSGTGGGGGTGVGGGSGGSVGGGSGGGSPDGGTDAAAGGSVGRTWSVAEAVETDRTDYDTFPKVAMNAAGNGMVAWQRGSAIWARSYDGTLRTWGTAGMVAPSAAFGNFDVGLDDVGNVMIIWAGNSGTAGQGIWWSRSTNNGTSWSVPKNISPTTYSSGPSLAVGSNGTALAAWTENPGNNLFTVVSSDFRGVEWNTTLNTPRSGIDSGNVNPRVAVDGQGRGFLVWEQPATSGDFISIWVERYDATWSAASIMTLESLTTNSAYSASVALNETGAGTATWLQTAASGEELWARRFDGTTWLTPEIVATGSSFEFDPVPEVAIAPNASSVAIWSQALPTNFNARASRHVAGAAVPWEAAQSLETNNLVGPTADYVGPLVGMDAVGNGIGVWRKLTGSGTSARNLIYTSRLDTNSTTWTPVNGIALHDDGTHDADTLGFAMSRNGSAMAVWSYGPEFDIWTSIYR